MLMNGLKVAIWTLAVIGMTPAILLAVLNMVANIAMARQLKKEAAMDTDEAMVVVSRSHVELGRNYRLEVTSLIWPSAVLLMGAGAFGIGLLNLIPRQTQFDEVQGFDRIEHYVDRVLNSGEPNAYVVIALADDDYTALTIACADVRRTIDFYIWRKEQIGPVLEFFSKREVIPIEDRISEEGTEFETRHLSFPLSGTAQEISQLCKSVFEDAYGVEDGAELRFTLGI